MSDKYLISALVDGVETYYTANSDGTIKKIGLFQDWDQAFNETTLANINNTSYATLTNAKVYVNSTSHKTASVETTGEGLIWTTEATEISTQGYSTINRISATGDSGVRYALSFNGSYNYMTRGTGLIPNTNAIIPSTADARTTAGVKINTVNEGIENAFDGDESTVYWINPGESRYVEIEFTTATRLLRHIIKLSSDSRMPVVAKFQGYDDDNFIWDTLDEITIFTDRSIDRTFKNDKDRHLYRWVLNYDDTAVGDNPELKTTVTELNAYGSTSGETWIECKPADVATKGMTASKMYSISSTQYAEIFRQGTLNLIAYIPSGNKFTSYNIEFPANSAPLIKDFVPSTNSFHAEDIDIRFNITDPEGTKCKYRVYVNNKLYPDENARWTDVTDSSGICKLTIENKYFDEVPGKNIIKIEAIDEDGNIGSQSYDITKTDELPETLNGTMFEDTYTFTITDKDAPDKVKYTASIINSLYVNGKQFFETDYLDNPTIGNVINIPPDLIEYGKENTLRIVLTDNVGGVSTFDVTFVGDYFGLLFLDENGKYLSSDIGKVIEKLDFGNVTGGMTSDPPMKVIAYNKSAKQLNGLTINTPEDGIDSGYEVIWEHVKDSNGNNIYFDKNGKEVTSVAKAYGKYYSDEDGNPVTSKAKVLYDKDHAGCKMRLIQKHIDGVTFAELSDDGSFSNEETLKSLPLGDLASYEKAEFFMRINATSYSIRVSDPDFVTSGSANYSE